MGVRSGGGAWIITAKSPFSATLCRGIGAIIIIVKISFIVQKTIEKFDPTD